MNILPQQCRSFSYILSHDPMPKEDFIKLAHSMASKTEQYLVTLIQMFQFSRIYKDGEQIIFE